MCDESGEFIPLWPMVKPSFQTLATSAGNGYFFDMVDASTLDENGIQI
jgi:hypothetical protein